MVKHTQTIRRLLPTNCLSVFDYFMGLALKGLMIWRADKDPVVNGWLDKKKFMWLWVQNEFLKALTVWVLRWKSYDIHNA